MDQDVSREVDLHLVKRIVEVRSGAANDLLEAGWILHDIYFSTDGDYRSNYIMVAMEDPICPHCSAPVKISVVENGDRVRFICTKECGFSLAEKHPVIS